MKFRPWQDKKISAAGFNRTRPTSQMSTHDEEVRLQGKKHVNWRMEGTGDTDVQIRGISR